MTLAITGRGVDYNVTAGADADGKVTFTVPAIVTGTEVTVTLVVKAADGSVLFAGSKTQVLDGSASPLSISLSRQYWAMPASISAAASPSTIAYEPGSVDSDSVTFNIIGLSDAPAGVTYSWTDESGTAVGTGPSLTRTVSQMLGGSVPSSGTLEKAYSVTVSYTDASGESRTLTASAAATIVTTTTLTLEGSGIQAGGGRMVLAVPKGSAAVSLHADVLCFGGTPSYSWTLTDGSAAAPTATLSGTTGQDNSVSFGPAGGSATVTVSADLGDGRILTRELYVYVLDAVISCSDIPAGGTAAFITEAATDSTVMTASLAGLPSLPGVTYEWQTDDIAVALTGGAAASEGEAATITPVAAGSTTVRLRASYLGVSSGWRTQELKVAGLKILTSDGAAAGDVLMELSDTSGVTRYASVVYGSGSETLAWNITEGSSVSIPGGATGGSLTITPAAGGKSVVTVSTNVNGRTLSKELTVYVFDLALSGGTSLSAPTPPDTSYSLMMTTSDTAGKTITASLNGSGMPAVTYSWTCADPALNYIIMDDSNSTSGTFTVKPKAAGTTSFSVMAYYNGSLTPVCSKTVDVTVAGVTITGSPVVKKGGTAVTLGATFQGFTTTPTVSSWSWAWKAGAASLATITSPASSTPSLASATAGGKTTLTVSAVVGGITLTAEKDIYVLDLKVSAPEGCETDASGNPKLNYGGTLDLTASLTGLTAADLAVLGTLSYSWSSGDATATPPEPAKALFTPDNTASTSASPISGDPAPVPLTVTVSWTGNATAGIAAASMDASIDVSIPLGLTVDELVDYLAHLPENDKDHPYKIPNITGLTTYPGSGSMSSYACQLNALKTCGRYLDLSGLTLPSSIFIYNSGLSAYYLPHTASDAFFRYNGNIVELPVLSPSGRLNLDQEFMGCTGLTTIPSGTLTNVVYLSEAFSGCTNLTDASGLGISPQTSNLESCFYNCKKLTTLPSIPTFTSSNTVSMNYCFKGCEALQDASSLTIAASQNMNLKQCFYGCKELTTPPAIQNTSSSKSVDMTSCFEGCEKLTAFPTLTISGTVNLNSCFKGCKALTSSSTITMPSRITDMTSCFEGCTALSGTTIIFPSTSPTDPSKWTDAFKNVSGVILKVPSSPMKAAVQSASGNSGITVYCPDDPEYALY